MHDLAQQIGNETFHLSIFCTHRSNTTKNNLIIDDRHRPTITLPYILVTKNNETRQM